ncbi:hypothetical protein Lesp02_39290 [Lentzea sp. NBRC 105346]|uniref:ArsR/SmtB family transcription factor n=1 Tax=Lentzea sp. NBRC 105346 TaxID=3032205 RepID=UPI0024A0ED0E|nr:winged helix-turn-helix domain-containing protein [Lentzea sp. NBRC 105346]GLZ31741.1 hypothetical protein Lesp02_39290 [Lentzea sp. NBRC 105346]
MLRLHFTVADLALTRFGGPARRGAWQLGVGEELNSLHPAIGWNAPTLFVDALPDEEITLDGRGIRLRPEPGPIRLLREAQPQPVLCYPVVNWPHREVELNHEALAGVLGHTRARSLRALTAERTTSGLADELGVSLSTASQAATALRNAGLITTRRDGRRVLHKLTTQGRVVLQGMVAH